MDAQKALSELPVKSISFNGNFLTVDFNDLPALEYEIDGSLLSEIKAHCAALSAILNYRSTTVLDGGIHA